MNDNEEQLLKMLNEVAHQLTVCKKKLIACEAKNAKYFEYDLNTRKNGSKFIKILVYSNESFGYVEVGRINISKNEWVRNNFSMEDILEDVRS